MQCWTDGEEYDDNEGNVVLPRTGSDEPVDGVVRTTGSDEPVDGVVCTSGPDEPVSGVTPSWTGAEECVVYAGEQRCPIRSTVLLIHLGWMIRMAPVLRMVKIMKVLLPYTGPVEIRHSIRLLVSSAWKDPGMRPGR